ncbi:hypothetical protein [Candidatus Uabimicrobium amorphum]|uniref:Uncharacterized protein n=1 Tax=Uabimicrobium amorphum TaxID=2596890 RepID=A0A5S9F6P4_UABAM|nr:hypothetical protein [Candidatus Uabimicrobium amorphum]BBM87872.1 hypothetical protein UABAM_06287 [Candidatus Uabimicrobium amorphum]
MKNIFIVLAILLLSVALMAQSVEERLPENSVFVVTFPNIEKAVDALQNTSLARLTRDPQIREVIAGLMEPYQEQLQPFLMQYHQAMQQAEQVALGEITVAVTAVNMREQIPVEAVVCIELKKGMQLAQQALPMLEQQMQKDENGVYHMPGMAHLKVTETHLLAATSMDLLNLVSADHDKSLKNNAAYQKAKKKVQKDHTPGIFVHINTAELYKTFSPMFGKKESEVFQSLHLNKLNSVSMALNIAGDHLHDALFIDFPGHSPLKDLLIYEPVSEEILTKMPATTHLALAVNFSLQSLLNKIEKLILAVEPREIRGFRREMELADNELRMSFKNDLGTLFGEMALFQYSNNNSGLIPHTMLIAQCNDPVTFGKLLGMIQKEVRMFSSHKMVYKGRTLHYFSVTAKRRWGGWHREDDLIATGVFLGGMGFFFDDGYIHLGQVQTLKDYINTHGKNNLTTNGDFQKAHASLTVKNPSIFAYRNLRSGLSTYWNTFLPALRSLEGYARAAGIPLETALLPDGDTLGKYFTPAGLGFVTNTDGVSFESYSHMGGLKMLGLPIFALFLIEEGLPYRQRRKVKREIENLFNALEDLIGDASPFRSSRIAANESSAIGTLRSISSSQALFQSGCYLDRNQNGVGEYAFLQELTGQSGRLDKPVKYGFLSRTLQPNYRGVAQKSGYYFRMYLPGSQGFQNAIAESSKFSDKVSDETISNQEIRFICYAWPVNYRRTGKRAFCVTESGEVFATENNAKRYTGNYEPEVNAAFSGKNESPTYGQGSDGQYWSSAY